MKNSSPFRAGVKTIFRVERSGARQSVAYYAYNYNCGSSRQIAALSFRCRFMTPRKDERLHEIIRLCEGAAK